MIFCSWVFQGFYVPISEVNGQDDDAMSQITQTDDVSSQATQDLNQDKIQREKLTEEMRKLQREVSEAKLADKLTPPTWIHRINKIFLNRSSGNPGA